MQLDKFTDYSLRLLMALNARAPERLSVVHIADLYDLSSHHLSKVASALVRDGFVQSERGRGGGLTLARPADRINVGAVVRAMTRNTAVAECFATGGTSCKILPACGLRDPLFEAQEAFYGVLDRYSLADITGSATKLAALLTPQEAV